MEQGFVEKIEAKDRLLEVHHNIQLYPKNIFSTLKLKLEPEMA